MTRRPARERRKPTFSRTEYARLQKEFVRVRLIVKDNAQTLRSNAEQLAALRHDCATNFRRCGELQVEIDRLKHALIVASASSVDSSFLPS